MSRNARMPVGPPRELPAECPSPGARRPAGAAARHCVQCGCSTLHACRLANEDRCYWVLEDLCSNPKCLGADPRTPMLPLGGPRSPWAVLDVFFRPIDIASIPRDSVRRLTALPEPPPEVARISQWIAGGFLLDVLFLDQNINAVEISAWIDNGSRRAERWLRGRLDELRLVRRSSRIFVVRAECTAAIPAKRPNNRTTDAAGALK